MNGMPLYKILVIDDNPAIYEDLCKILIKEIQPDNLYYLEKKLFNKKQSKLVTKYKIDFAHNGQDGVKLVADGKSENQPYSLAFVDIRMPGWDGIETIEHIWAIDENIQVVICTAFSDYSWQETVERLGSSDNLLILKKPFDNIAVQQMALALTKKWQLSRDAEKHLQLLEDKIKSRTFDLNESLSLVKATLDSATDGIVVINNKDRVIDYNHKFLELMSDFGKKKK